MNGKTIFILFRASERFTIVPSWEDYSKESEDELCIELDPGMAFWYWRSSNNKYVSKSD